MAIIGVASIRVKPDLTAFRKELKAGLEAINTDLTIKVKAEVNTEKVRVELDRLVQKFDGKDINLKTKLDRSALDRVRAALGALGRGGGAFLGIAGASGLSATLTLSKLALVAGALATSIAGLGTVVGGLGQALFQVGVAAGGIAVAGLTALVGVVGTLKFGMKGLGDAFKAVSEGDSKQLKESLKGLAPEAQKFVLAIAKLKPELDKLRTQVQSNIFADLAKSAQQTGHQLIGIFKGPALEIGSTFNGILKESLKFLKDPTTLGSLSDIGKNVSDGFRNASGAIKPILSAIVNIIHSATALLPKLGQGFADVATKFSNFIQNKSASGELTKFFENGIEKAKQFGRILRDFGVGIANIFRKASGESGGFLNILEKAASKFRTFTESFKGQDTLTEVFKIIKDLSGSFHVFLKALEPLLPIIGELAKILADSLGKILEALGPIIEGVAETIGKTLKDILPQLVPVVVKFAEALGKILEAAIPLAKPLVKILDALTPLLDPLVELAQTVLPALAKILDALAPVIEALAKVLGFLVTAVAKAIDGFVHLGDTIGQAFTDPGALVRNIVTLMNGEVRKEFPRLGDTIRNSIDSVFAQFSNLPGATTAANNVIRRFVDGIQNMFPTLKGALNQINDLIRETLGLPPRQQAKEDGAAITNALGDGIASTGEQMARQAAAVIDRVFVLLGLKLPAFEESGRKIAESLGGGISAGAPAVSNATTGIAGVVRGVMNGISLYGQGTATVESFISGVKARFDAVRSVLFTLTTMIPVWKGPMSLDKKLLTPTGEAIIDGLVVGLKGGLSSVESVLGQTTDLISAAVSPGAFSGSIQASASLLADSFDPTPVFVNIDLNRELLQNFVQTEIGESNRSSRRKIVGGVSP